jgi:hypothetical protein
MCGENRIPGAVSPNSETPLLLVATLDLGDPRLNVPPGKVERLHLFYPWTCAGNEGVFSYRETGSEVELLSFTSGEAYTDFPYPNYPPFFPEVGLALEPISAAEQDAIHKLNRGDGGYFAITASFPRLAVPPSQVGGEPLLLQNPLPERRCPSCQNLMPLLACIGDRNGSEHGFVDNDFVQMLFYFCAPCTVVISENQTD